jgi:hypothetical protein
VEAWDLKVLRVTKEMLELKGLLDHRVHKERVDNKDLKGFKVISVVKVHKDPPVLRDL